MELEVSVASAGNSAQKAAEKDWWDRVKIVVEIVIAITGLTFTFLYNRTNTRLQRVQIQSTLVSMLVSGEEEHRRLALVLAQELDEAFAAKAATALAIRDASPSVRLRARSVLRGLTQSSESEVRRIATRTLDRSDVLMELQDKGLLEKLDQARGYYGAQSVAGRQEALKLYQEVVHQLSDGARRRLDQNLLARTDQDMKQGNVDSALEGYHALFSDYR